MNVNIFVTVSSKIQKYNTLCMSFYWPQLISIHWQNSIILYQNRYLLFCLTPVLLHTRVCACVCLELLKVQNIDTLAGDALLRQFWSDCEAESIKNQLASFLSHTHTHTHTHACTSNNVLNLLLDDKTCFPQTFLLTLHNKS